MKLHLTKRQIHEGAMEYAHAQVVRLPTATCAQRVEYKKILLHAYDQKKDELEKGEHDL